METQINQVIEKIDDKPTAWKHLLAPEKNMLYLLLSCPFEGKFRLYLIGINTVNFETFWTKLTYTALEEDGPSRYRKREVEVFEQ